MWEQRPPMSTHPTMTLADRRVPLPDVQAEAPKHAIGLAAVGVKDMRLPLVFDFGPAIATLTLSVDLPAGQRGAHMSRFRRGVDSLPEGLTPSVFAHTLASRLLQLHDYARVARVDLCVDVPVSDLVVPVRAHGLAGITDSLTQPSDSVESLEVVALGSTVCPCSFAMSGERYAHVQRAQMTARIDSPTVSVAELHRLVVTGFSAPTAMFLDRPGEKALVDRMFAHPRFVEDAAREAVAALQAAKAGTRATLTAVAFESIHPYDCYATWSGALI